MLKFFKHLTQTVGGVILAIVLVVGGVFGTGWLSLTVYQTFATRWESARTDVYRENKSYVEGTIRDLRNLKREYFAATDEHRSAVKSLILHRSDELDRDRLPSDIKDFLNTLDNN